MKRLVHNRGDLIDLLRDYPLSRPMARAIDDTRGRVEVLGGFTPPEGFPYWGVWIRSRHGREWIVAVAADDVSDRLIVRRMDQARWEHWAGDPETPNPLTNGDNPDDNRLKRRIAQSSHDTGHGGGAIEAV